MCVKVCVVVHVFCCVCCTPCPSARLSWAAFIRNSSSSGRVSTPSPRHHPISVTAKKSQVQGPQGPEA